MCPLEVEFQGVFNGESRHCSLLRFECILLKMKGGPTPFFSRWLDQLFLPAGPAVRTEDAVTARPIRQQVGVSVFVCVSSPGREFSLN